MCCPHVRSVGGEVRFLSVMTACRQTTERQRIVYGEAACIRVLESLLTSKSTEVNLIHYNVHEAAGHLSRVKAKPDINKVTLSPLPLG